MQTTREQWKHKGRKGKLTFIIKGKTLRTEYIFLGSTSTFADANPLVVISAWQRNERLWVMRADYYNI
jgi:hypothetical protein